MKLNNKILAAVLVVSAGLILCTGCRMTAEQYSQWEALIKQQGADYGQKIKKADEAIALENEKLAAKADEKEYLLKKAALLEKENAVLENAWRQIRWDFRDAFGDVLSAINEQQELFFDVHLGAQPQKMTMGTNFLSQVVLIDMENTVPEDTLLQAVEIYSQIGPRKNASNYFYAATFAKNPKGDFVVKAVSPALEVLKAGINRYNFIHAPLHAVKGDYYGLILQPNVAIDYEELDLGMMQTVPVKMNTAKLPGNKFRCQVPLKRGDSQRLGSRRVSFSIMGMSLNKYSFIADVKNPVMSSGTVSSVTINCTKAMPGAGGEPKLLKCYLAVFRWNSAMKCYRMAALSNTLFVKENENANFPIKNSNAGIVRCQPGDLCVLIVAPGKHGRQVTFDNARYRMTVQVFNPMTRDALLAPPQTAGMKSEEAAGANSVGLEFIVNF